MVFVTAARLSGQYHTRVLFCSSILLDASLFDAPLLFSRVGPYRARYRPEQCQWVAPDKTLLDYKKNIAFC